MSKTEEQLHRQKVDALFYAARYAQSEYWNALAALEEELGIEIDGTANLDDTSPEELIGEATKEVS